MNKKQGIIIVTLLALIVCVGILATKSNSTPFVSDNSSDSNKSAFSLKNNSNDKKSATTDFFTEARLTKVQESSKALQNLKTVMDNKNIAEEDRRNAANKYTTISTAGYYENKIETALKSSGFEDVICQVEEDGIRVIVKSKDKLTDKQTKEIKNTVLSISKVNQVTIQTQY